MVSFKEIRYDDKKIVAKAGHYCLPGKVFNVVIDRESGDVTTNPTIDEESLYEVEIRKASWVILYRLNEWDGKLDEEEYVNWG